jgi:hypothetical protein
MMLNMTIKSIVNYFLIIFISSLSATVVMSQEVERDLRFMELNPHNRNTSDVNIRGGGSAPMGLPFLDDFAWPSSFEESGYDRPELVRWDSSPVRRTSTFAINPPTIGVATLDGLDEGGYPYAFSSNDPHGWADTLTSRKILLGGITADDDVILSFWFEGGGIGNSPDLGEDTLVVEFKSIGLEGDIWTRVWSNDTITTDEFIQVTIPIQDGVYLHNSFQFRFRNYGSLEGNVDLWHIDYVFVAENGATGNPQEELAFLYPAHTLLRNFSAMPWTHYTDNPEFYMKDTLYVENKNFGTGPNNQENTGVKIQVGEEAPLIYNNEFIQNVSVPVGPFSTEYLSDLLDSDGVPASVLYDPLASDTTVTFEVTLWEEEVGYYTNQSAVYDNDSIGFAQVFDNYYSYDDGSAEKAYSLESMGGQLAIRYPLSIADTLDGIKIHFTPYYDNAELETFVIKVWADDAGYPGEQIDTMYQFHSPHYFTDGHDQFAYYSCDHPIPVSGVIHVGFIQQNVEHLNIGLDKNTNSNAGNLHYKLGIGANWIASEIQGSVMIHPVLRAGKDAPEPSEIWEELSMNDISSNLYPNPTSSIVSFKADEALVWSVFSLNGNIVLEGKIDSAGVVTFNASEISPGVYFVNMRSSRSVLTSSKRLVILPN